MDGFSIIQHFFTRMRCNACDAFLEPEGIQLIRHEKGVYVVNVHCVRCSKQMGIALVGLEDARVSQRQYADPELTEQDLERLSKYAPITYDDVLDAHEFFTNLDSDWRKYLPEEMPRWETEPESEYEVS